MEIGLFNFLSCREVSKLVAEGALEEAPLWAFCLIRFHLFYCRDCRKFAREIALLGHAAREWSKRLVEPAAVEAFERKLIGRLGAQ